MAPAAKKRKASDARSSAPPRCSLCGFGASTLDHLLTHVRETHERGRAQPAPQMGTPH
jgi:hypothetical protein